MLFHSLDYFLFLAIVLTGYWLLRYADRSRIALVVVASCLFYMAWNPVYIVLILTSTLLDYVAGARLGATQDPRLRKFWLGLSLCGNLGLLFAFKYFNFFAQASADIASLFGLHWKPLRFNVLLPVGISFYTFQTLSYTIDVYRGQLAPARSFGRCLFFVTYFPQLVAGPIVRASEFLPQLENVPRLRRDEVAHGLFLIATGLAKKILVADYLSVNLVDRIFDNPEGYTATEVVAGLYGFTMQIYCDFSGYTDVARGSAMLMGIELPENFDRPYLAQSPADFWRRWHMTLSTWLRDYLYFPLGGSRAGPLRAYWNLWITLFLIGLWHGASWTFVLYGILQATAMVLHRAVYRRFPPREGSVWLRAFKVAACLQFVVFSRILFRAADLTNAKAVTRQLFSGTTSMAQIAPGVWLVLVASFAAHFLPKVVFQRTEQSFVRAPWALQGAALALAAWGLSRIATSQVVPYIYFQF